MLWKTKFPKKRFGNPHGDGGYVLIDSAFGSSVLLGYGIAQDASFEDDAQKHFGLKAYGFDHTTPDSFQPPDGVTLVREKMTAESFEEHMKKYVPEGETCILKIDIEGDEWEILKTINLSRVTQLAIELHDVKKLPDIDNFLLVHIHGNNCHNQPMRWFDRSRTIPRVLECTYINKTCTEVEPDDEGIYPTEYDSKNRPDVDDVPLNFWKTRVTPISFVTKDDSLLRHIMCVEDEVVKDCSDARHDWIFQLKEGDVFPIQIILSIQNTLDTSTRQFDSVYFPCVYKGVTMFEKRMYRRDVLHMFPIQSNQPIFNLVIEPPSVTEP